MVLQYEFANNQQGYFVTNLDGGTITYTNGGVTTEVATINSIESVIGHADVDDIIYGSAADNVLDAGGEGNDILHGGDGDDMLIAHLGTRARGGAGNDIYRVHKGSTNGTTTLRDMDSSTEASTVILHFEVEDFLGTRLEGDDVVIRLANDNGTETQLRLENVYVRESDGSHRLGSHYTFLTHDGFIVIPQWQQRIGSDETFNPRFVARYNATSDQPLTATFGDTVPNASFHLEANSLTLFNDSASPRKSRVVNLPEQVSLLAEGSPFDDVISGGDDNDVIRGYHGDDLLMGNKGSDIYLVNIDFGEVNDHQVATTEYQKTDLGEKVISNFDSGRTVTQADGSTQQVYDTDYLTYRLPRHAMGVRTEGNDVILFNQLDASRAAQVRLRHFLSHAAYRHISLIDESGAVFELGVDAQGQAYLSDEGVLVLEAGQEVPATPWVKASVFGTTGNDVLRANSSDEASSDVLYGAEGNDTLVGGSGNDTLFGDAGNDLIVSSSGQDIISTGNGRDEVRFTGYAQGIKIVDLTATDQTHDVIWLPFAISSANVGREGNSLVIQGQASQAPSGQLLHVVLQDYYVSEDKQRVELRSYTPNAWGVENSTPTATETLSSAALKTRSATALSGFLEDDGERNHGGDEAVVVFASPGAASDDTLVVGNRLGETLYGGAGNDTLVYAGGELASGNLYGGEGDDTYEIQLGRVRGSSRGVSIYETIGGRSRDVVKLTGLGNGISASDVTFKLNSGSIDIYEQGIEIASVSNWHDELSTIEFFEVYEQVESRATYRWNAADITYALRYANGANISLEQIQTVLAERTVQQQSIATQGDDNLLLVAANYTGDDYHHRFDALSGDDVIAHTDQFSAGETSFIAGGEGHDLIDGSGSEDTLELFGEAGDDQLRGGLANDLLKGGAGNDTLTDYEGHNSLHGGYGEDVISGRGTLYGDQGGDILRGSEGNDTLYAGGATEVTHGNILTANAAGLAKDTLRDTNYLYGYGGDDALVGEEGVDIAHGGSGNDTIVTGLANDHLDGGTGNDFLKGGEGDDTYRYVAGEGRDQINDTGGANDVLNIVASDGDTLSRSEVSFAYQGNDLAISVSGVESVVIKKWKTESKQLETIHLSTGSDTDYQLSSANVDHLVQAMASFTQRPTAQSQRALEFVQRQVWDVVAVA